MKNWMKFITAYMAFDIMMLLALGDCSTIIRANTMFKMQPRNVNALSKTVLHK